MIKRLFCKHSWKIIRRPSVWLDGDYGCTKCGKLERVRYLDDETWRFKRNMKGDTFE